MLKCDRKFWTDKQSDKSAELLELLFATEDKVSPDNQSKGKIILTETKHRFNILPLLWFLRFFFCDITLNE